jgi:hypothetical protein
LKCICSRRDGRPFFRDSITALGDFDWTKSDHLLVAQQLARDWLGGSASMETLHVHTHHYSVLQCLTFQAQEASALLFAIVPLWRSFCKGHLVFDDWAKITIQMSHDTLLNDQTQKMMAHAMTQWLATVRPALFAARPLVQMDRLLWLKMLATTIRRSINNGTKDIRHNPGLAAIYQIVPGLVPFAETCHVSLDPVQVERFKSSYVTDRAALQVAFAANPGPVGSLLALTEHLRAGAPLTKVQAGQLMGFCTSHRDQSQFPDWEEMGILAPRAKGTLETSIGLGPFNMTTGKGILKTLQAEFAQDPTDENAGFIKCSKSHEWAGIQLNVEGSGTLTCDYTGVAREATGVSGELGVGNWRVSYGRQGSSGDILDPTRFGYSSAGVFCDPRIMGPAKWQKPGRGDLVPHCDYPIHYSFLRPTFKVTVNSQTVLNVALQEDEYPLVSFKGLYFRLQAEPKAAPVTKSVSWLDVSRDSAVASGGAGAPPPLPPPMRSLTRCDTICELEDPVVARFLAHMKTEGRDSVLTAIMGIYSPAGAITVFEKELMIIKDRIGTSGITKAMREAETLFNA